MAFVNLLLLVDQSSLRLTDFLTFPPTSIPAGLRFPRLDLAGGESDYVTGVMQVNKPIQGQIGPFCE